MYPFEEAVKHSKQDLDIYEAIILKGSDISEISQKSLDLLNENKNGFGIQSRFITPDGNNLIISCAQFNRKDILELLIFKGAGLNDLMAVNQETYKNALHVACSFKNLGVVKVLLESFNSEIYGTDAMKYNFINAVDKHGWTPLHYACFCGRFYKNAHVLVDLLIKNGAKLNFGCAGENRTALHVLCMNCDSVFESEMNRNALNWRRVLFKIAEILVLNGLNLEAIDSKGNTALHIASMIGHSQIVNLLISSGANVSAKIFENLSPIECKINCKNVYRLLLEAGASGQFDFINGWSALKLLI